MKKIIGLFLMFVILITTSLAKDVVLPEIFNANFIEIRNDNIYVVQEENVFIYNLKDFKFKNKFGKTGEGPQSFQKIPVPWIPSISLYFKGSDVFINSVGKISLFNKDGEYIREQATTVHGVFGRVIPIDGIYYLIKYVQDREQNKQLIVASILDKDLKMVKKITSVLFPAQSGEKRNPILMAKMSSYFDRYSYKEKFVLPYDNGNIKIFDKSGKELVSFKPEYTLVKMNKAQEEKLDNFFTNSPFYKRPYLQDKGRGLITFGDSLPIFNYYRLTDDKIYILSNYKKDQKYETFIYDFSGKLLKKTFIPLKDKDLFDVFPFTISKNKVYQLVYSEEEEETRLEINQIK